MKRRIFYSSLLVTTLTALITILSVLFIFFPFMETELLQEMQKEVDLIEEGMDGSDPAFLAKVADKDRRLSLIDKEGNVLFDSDSDVESLDNHADREEILQAEKNGNGSSIRFSRTLTVRTINYAKKLKDGNFLRMTISQNYVITLLAWLFPPIAIIIAVAVFLSVLISAKVSNSILKPLYELDLEHPEENEIYEEIRPLTERIVDQNRRIKEKIYMEMDQKSKKRHEFTTNLTHELKTPLTSISGFAELMMNEKVDEETVKDFSRSIYDEAGRLIHLVGDIIKVGELDEKRGSYDFRPVDLKAVAEDVCKRLEMTASKRNIRVETPKDPAKINGVENILYEMIYNLCDNAIKYNKEGGMVRVSVFSDQQNAKITVEDSGIGIPKEEQSRIFDRFYRVDKSHSRELGGTGLGLSIVRQGADLHGAEIQIDSSEGKGTAVTLIFSNSRNSDSENGIEEG
ncbi:MAG: ATP-binding protein [Lachnospiraceae bacterium]|nr:ATP-binding protein [Lachnospiraceae bacterium]